jgi:hypothetical protein
MELKDKVAWKEISTFNGYQMPDRNLPSSDCHTKIRGVLKKKLNCNVFHEQIREYVWQYKKNERY